MQYVGVGLLTGGASVLTAVITTIMVNARHLFYSISMIGKYRDAGAYKPYFIFALTDETYSLLCDDDVSCVTVVMVTGTGRSYALGYNLVLRYLEAGDIVIATVRRPSSDIDSLKEKYGERLIVATMDLLDSESVNRAAKEVAEKVDHIDTLINNAVGVSPDCDKGFFEADLDLIPRTIDLIAVGTMRVIKAFYPLLTKAEGTALIMNISSEAGSIEKCYRTNMIDYGMGKAALNMATMNLFNTFRDEKKVNIFAVHPGWIRTDGKEDNPAPLSSYEAAGILKDLFAERREDFTGHRFITNEGLDYPF